MQITITRGRRRRKNRSCIPMIVTMRKGCLRSVVSRGNASRVPVAETGSIQFKHRNREYKRTAFDGRRTLEEKIFASWGNQFSPNGKEPVSRLRAMLTPLICFNSPLFNSENFLNNSV